MNIDWLESGSGVIGGDNPALEIGDNSTIGNRIKKIGKSQGLTQAEFAARLGVSNMTVFLAERGYKQRNADLVDRISQKFGVSKEWIMFVTGSYELDSIVKDAVQGT